MSADTPSPARVIFGAFLLADRLEEDVRSLRRRHQYGVRLSVDELAEIAGRIRALADVARDYHNTLQLTGTSTPPQEPLHRGPA